MAKQPKAAGLAPADILKPYLSSALLSGKDGLKDDELLASAMAEAIKLIDGRKDRKGARTFDREGGAGELQVQAHIYSHRRLSSWATQQFYDETHELLIIGVKQGIVAVSCSEAAIRDMLVVKIPGLAPLLRETLERAFVGTRANAMWLSGVHTPTASKATSKALLGPELELALDPLGDQSYFYSAVRSMVPVDGTNVSIGTAPSSGRIWTGRKTWTDYRQALATLIDQAAAARAAPPARQSWLSILADRTGDIAVATDPYAIAIVPPELLQEGDIDAGDRAKLIDWAYRSDFEVIDNDGPSPIATVKIGHAEIGTLRLNFEQKGERIVAVPEWIQEIDGFADERAACSELVKRLECLRIYYDGLTLADGYLFDPAYRDQPFSWTFQDFADFAVEDEKPKIWGGKKLADLIADKKADGSDEDSLFAYVVKRLFPKGWLASDDGSMEFADFVHIEPASHRVTLIHVKGSNKADKNRGVSVSSYEVVVGQAVKNIRHLDRSTLEEVLREGEKKEIARAVWLDGKRQANRKGIIAAAAGLKPGHEKVVIVLQPQLTRKELEACRSANPTATAPRIKRMKQLDTLMLSARLSCAAVGAELIGIGAE